MNRIPFPVDLNVDANDFEPMRIHSEDNSRSNLQALPINIANIIDNHLLLMQITPQKFDVLCGKEKVCINHEGNRHFRKVIDLYREKYQQCTTKHEKMVVTKEIYNNLQQSLGTRFLRYNTKTKAWDEISEIIARDKISHALRFATLKQKEQQRQQTKVKLKHQGKAISTRSDSGKKLPERSSTFSVASSYSGLPSCLKEVIPHKATAAINDDNKTEEPNLKIANPVMRRCESDPLPIKMWDQFVERQQNLMRSIQTETKPSAPSSTEQERSRLMKIIDERPDLLIKGPLLSMDDCSVQFDEDDLSLCIDVFD